MPPTFASAEARIGRAIAARLANARLVVSGSGTQVDGIFTRSPVVAPLGGLGMRSRDSRFECLAAAGTELVDGATVTAYVGDQLVTPAGTYKVRGEPITTHEIGWLSVDLELAS